MDGTIGLTIALDEHILLFLSVSRTIASYGIFQYASVLYSNGRAVMIDPGNIIEPQVALRPNNYKLLVPRPGETKNQEIHAGGRLLLLLFTILLVYYSTLNKPNKQYKAL